MSKKVGDVWKRILIHSYFLNFFLHVGSSLKFSPLAFRVEIRGREGHSNTLTVCFLRHFCVDFTVRLAPNLVDKVLFGHGRTSWQGKQAFVSDVSWYLAKLMTSKISQKTPPESPVTKQPQSMNDQLSYLTLRILITVE